MGREPTDRCQGFWQLPGLWVSEPERAAVARQGSQAGGKALAVPGALVGILLLAAALRLAGLAWDGGQAVHPDERRILMVVGGLHWPRPWDWSQVLGPRSPLNPRFFAYGSLPIYLLRLLSALTGVPADRLYPEGRALSAGFDLLTVAVIYQAGRRLGGRRVGLMAAALLAVAVLPIQLSHFLTVDTLLTLLCTLSVYTLLRVAESGSWRAGAVAGALAGLALATKTSALPLLFVGWAAWAVWALGKPGVPQLGRGLGGLILSTGVAVISFLLAEPYSLIDWFRFGSALVQEAAMAQGQADLPYTRQYIGTLPYLYPLQQLLLWSLGLPLGLVGLAGVLWLTWRGIRRRGRQDLVLLSWLWPYFLIVGSFQAKFLRYMAPLVPWLCLAGALLLGRIGERARAGRWLARLVSGLGALVFLATLLYALSFVGLYLRPHPWLEASAWLCQTAPEGSVLAVEVWDDPLPLAGLRPCRPYQSLPLDLYAPDSEEKAEWLAEALARADYVVLSSQRLYGSIGRLPERYPLTTAYYRLLFSEELGFRLAGVWTSYPRLGPVAIVDEPLVGTVLPQPALLRNLRPAPLVLNLGRADESYSVYDHPRVLIFQKEVALPPDRLRTLLLSGQKSNR